MEIDLFIRILLQAELGHGLSVSNVWVGVAHIFKNHLRPILRVVFLSNFFNSFHITFVEGHLIGTWGTVCVD